MVLTAVALSAVITAFTAAVLWSQAHNPEYTEAGSSFLEFLPAAARQGIPISIFATLFLLSYLTHRKRRIIYFGISLVVSFALLWGATLGLSRVPAVKPARQEAAARFIGTYIHALRDQDLYLESVNGNTINQVVLVENTVKNDDPRFTFYLHGSVDEAGSEISFPDGKKVPIIPENPLFSRLFAPEEGISRVLEDIAFLSRSLPDTYGESATLFYLYAGSLCLFCVCCSLFAAITNWPVVNLILILLSARFFIFLPRFLSGAAAAQMSRTLTGAEPGTILLSSIFVILSLLLLGWDLLFIHKGKQGGADG